MSTIWPLTVGGVSGPVVGAEPSWLDAAGINAGTGAENGASVVATAVVGA